MKFGQVLFILFLLAACGNKKNSGNGDAVMEVKEFFAIFKPVKLPYIITDTSFTKAVKDTTIDAGLLSQFVGDTVLTNLFGTVKPRLTPAGRVSAKKAETY